MGFNVEQVSASAPETTSPFAAASNNVAMVFQGALDESQQAVTEDSVGASGDLYINLQNFMRTRDGMRQTVLDLLNLNASLGDMDINGDGMADELDTDNVYFLG